MVKEGAIAKLDAAMRALAEAKDISTVLDIRDKAEAIRIWLRASQQGLRMQNDAAHIRICAERKAGEMLAGMEKQAGARTQRSNSVLPRLEDLGISKMQSSRWQLLASIDEDEYLKIVAHCQDEGKELTQAALLKKAKQKKSQEVDNQTESISGIVTSIGELGEQRFGTIYADPPWRYGNQGTRAATDNHYITMSVDELCQLPVQSITKDDAHLHLWTTNAFLFDAKSVMEAWGFTYKSCFVWVKPQMGIGNYWRVSHEFLLLGVKGKAKSFASKNLKSWAAFERKKHSAKPEQIRSMIEFASPGPYLEMFGRRQVEGWVVLGNQVERMLAV